MTSVFQSGHQRNCSQAQLLTNAAYEETATSTASSSLGHCVESGASPYDVDLVACPLTAPLQGDTTTIDNNNPTNTMRFSTLSDCSSYYGLPGTHTENETRYLCKNPYLRTNVGVVLGAVVLALVGSALLIFGLFVMLYPNDLDIHGWVILVIGVLFFIPGAYHVVFILCVLGGHPGYSFDNLPTFSKPS